MKVAEIYNTLLKSYGQQGWWPIPARVGTEGFNEGGYHPGVFPGYDSYDRYQIIAGAILTQNTTWKNARKALVRLLSEGIEDGKKLLSVGEDRLAELIRTSGYYNQKAKKLKLCLTFFHEGGYLETGNPPARDELLELWGIGPETADSILLYAFNVPVFVIDAYTKRFFARLYPSCADYTYEKMRCVFQNNLRRNIQLYQEYHALIVRHCKGICRKKPNCTGCSFSKKCSFQRSTDPDNNFIV